MTVTAGAERARLLIVLLASLLIAIVVAWQLQARVSAGRLIWAAILTLPLSLPLRGLIRRSRRTYAAMTLCVIPYFVLSMTEAIANPSNRGWAAACLGSSMLLFVALIAYLRLTRATPSPP